MLAGRVFFLVIALIVSRGHDFFFHVLVAELCVRVILLGVCFFSALFWRGWAGAGVAQVRTALYQGNAKRR